MALSTKVAVSGITGFIGAQVAADLLKRGYTVHGTVRKNTPERVAHLTNLDGSIGELNVFEADLLSENSFDAAVETCDYAIHVASPYAMEVSDAQKELVEPAVKGTLSFLGSCKKAGVKKVVLTSSLAAIADGGVKGKVFDESDWNTHSSLKYLPYYYSKAQAEKAAWDFIEKEAPEIKLVVINPVAVFGPSLVKSVNETAAILKNIVDGMFGGIVDLELPVVDVRDVSEAHIRAMESDSASGRYLCVSNQRLMSVAEMTETANELGFKAPTRNLRSKLATEIIKIASYLVPGGVTGQFVRGHLGNPIVLTNAKIVKDLEMEFRDPKDIIKDTFDNLLEWGHMEKPSA